MPGMKELPAVLKKIASAFSLLDKPAATSQELRQALAALDIDGAERAVDQLEAQRQSLLLRGSEQEIETIEADIRAGNREVERRHAMKREMEKRLAEAEERERLENLEATAANARDAQARMMAAYLELDGLATRVVELLNALDVDWRVIQASNRTAIDSDRRDLKVNHPLGMLAQQLGRPVENLPQVNLWSLHGYRPRHPDGRLLGRMRDLMPSAARKAAA